MGERCNLTHKFKGLVKETTYEICTKASDNAGNGEQISNIVEITTEKIDKPQLLQTQMHQQIKK